VIRPYEYNDLLQLMIESWRKKWDQPGLPFLIVQLPNYNPRLSEPAESNWASLRAAQDSILSVPNTGIVVTYDIGEEKELHPRDKRTVGERLSLLAQQMVYKTAKPEKAFSPHAIEAKRWRKKIVIRFSPAVKLTTNDGQAPRQVAVCGPDGKFMWATTSIHGNKMYVKSDAFKNIQRIRYAWADNPDANVFGENGLPVAPFDIAVTD
jgi:sialate O-acetylesterase